ncbi:MAG TPA: ATP-dependent DNA helicase, partial [Candidatus Saccharimonadales bacterium]|nr:ATP-dependent DNA helicase [Candidatus Saccharimonadales bacterium]
LASKLNDEYTHLSDSLSVISELKKSGLTSDELLQILDENNAVIEKAEQLLSPIFAEKISKKTAEMVAAHIDAIRRSDGEVILSTVTPLSDVLADSLQAATDEAIVSNSTKPITAWRNQWFKKNDQGTFILKSHERQIKLRALSFIYEQYLARMQEAELYDFDDMILRVVHAMEIFDDLRFNLQEKYQYIMVDEFQDTNMAQMRILHNLTNNEAHGDTPNIMAVGDDDQAIYSFQGADISNIINFRTHYPKTHIIALTDNYRSTATILEGSRDVIVQGKERLENIIEDLNKRLTAHNDSPATMAHIYEAETITDERLFIAEDIKRRIDAGEEPQGITVLTRRHHEINALLPYFYQAGITVNYERRDNVLDQSPIILIEQLACLLIDLHAGHHDSINARLPEILAHPAWGIKPLELWKLSTKAYESHSRWLDTMAVTPLFIPLHAWLVETASLIGDTPLEQMLDIIIGKNNTIIADDTQEEVAEDDSFKLEEIKPEFISPFYDYFFSPEMLSDAPDTYLAYLEALRTIRSKLREYRPDKTPTLQSFVDFIALNRRLGSTISTIRRSAQADNAINIMTAHKSKGLEFNTVYITNAVDNAWGESARSRSRLIGYPENLPLAPVGENSDERLRLFYVAMTRAKRHLHISYSLHNDTGKSTLRAAFLVHTAWPATQISPPHTTELITKTAEIAWYQPVISPVTTDMRSLVMPSLENYKLSVTHLHNFLDVSRGGPSSFLLQNLLRFPQAKSPQAAFGTAIHDTLSRAHSQVISTGRKQAIEDILSNFENILQNQRLAKRDYDTYLDKGSATLQTFLDARYDSFSKNQIAELNFAGQHSIVGEAHITGSLDLVDVDKSQKTIMVTDYKTGKPARTWSGKDEYAKIKLHKYKQQLLFYKLLVEHARDWHAYTVESGILQFVEPTQSGEILSLQTDFNSDELQRFTDLINAVWKKIITFNLPDTSSYDQSYKGILAFEQDLLDSTI